MIIGVVSFLVSMPGFFVQLFQCQQNNLAKKVAINFRTNNKSKPKCKIKHTTFSRSKVKIVGSKYQTNFKKRHVPLVSSGHASLALTKSHSAYSSNKQKETRAKGDKKSHSTYSSGKQKETGDN